MPKPYTIGSLARQVSVNVETIRYYQRRGSCRSLPNRRAASGAMPKSTHAGCASSRRHRS
jgi:hypothetical protein